MQQHPLFRRTRLQLAGWYAGVMGVILGLCGLVTYELVAMSYWQAVDQELDAIAGTLHDSLEAKLLQPDRMTPRIEQEVLPGLCIIGQPCHSHPTLRHILGAVQQDDYYLQFFDRTGNLVAHLGQAALASTSQQQTTTKQTWQDNRGIRYRQVKLSLKTVDTSFWGTMQIGRSLQSLDLQLARLQLQIMLGLPGGVIVIGLASWWLAGRAMRPIYQSYAQMQQFTADAAHELRTPLAAIRATIEATRRQAPLTLPAAEAALATLDRQNQRLIQLAQGLLFLARIEVAETLPQHPQATSDRQPCLLNDLVCDVVESLAVLEIGDPITLLTELRVEAPLYVMGNEEQLTQLLSNLITNALQYTAAGGKVWVILEQQHDQAVIQVKDTGQGIAPADQARIFDRFYRVSGDRSRQTGGSGLGLAIAQAIVQAHQGTIQVESVLGQGTVFTVRLPIGQLLK